jgi:hypothetical protein
MPNPELWNSFILLGVAFFNAATAVMSWYTLRATRRVELHTNSMKDALVAAAKKEGIAQGKATEKAVPSA